MVLPYITALMLAPRNLPYPLLAHATQVALSVVVGEVAITGVVQSLPQVELINYL
jgi:hypothetical protein